MSDGLQVSANNPMEGMPHQQPPEEQDVSSADVQRFEAALALHDTSPDSRFANDGLIGKNELAINSGITGDQSFFLREETGNRDGFLSTDELKSLEQAGVIEISNTGQISLTTEGQAMSEYSTSGEGKLLGDAIDADTDGNNVLEGTELDKFISESVAPENQDAFRYLFDGSMPIADLQYGLDNDLATINANGQLVLTDNALVQIPVANGGTMQPPAPSTAVQS